MKKRVPECIKGYGPNNIQEVSFNCDSSAAKVTLNSGVVIDVTLQFSRKHPRGAYKDKSGRRYAIG